MERYNQALKLYGQKIDNDLGISKKGNGFIFLLSRCDKEGCVDLVSNMADESIILALKLMLKDVLKMSDTSKDECLGSLQDENKRLRKGLEDIMKHQGVVCKGVGVRLSTTYIIAERALEE